MNIKIHSINKKLIMIIIEYNMLSDVHKAEAIIDNFDYEAFGYRLLKGTTNWVRTQLNC